MIYHLAFRGDWAHALEAGEYRQSTKGRRLDEVGFIHCCATPSQVEQVAAAFYAGDQDLVVLVIDEARLCSKVRREPVPGFDTPLPHIYGPLNPEAVIDTAPLVSTRDGRFRFEPGGPEH